MKMTKLATPFVLAGLLTVGAMGSPVSAHTVNQGKPYGCQINPKQAVCQKAPQPTISGGNVTRVSTTGGQAPTALPASGGGAPAVPAFDLGALLAGAVLTVLGFAVRRRATRHS